MSAGPDFYTVFDLAQSGYRNWWFPGSGLIFIFVGAALIPARGPIKKLVSVGFRGTARRFGWFMFLFALVWTTGCFLLTYSDYLALKHAEEAGRFRIVEGEVQDFHPMPYEGHTDENFEVNGVRFAYSDYTISAGFNNTASHGGPIRQGLPVRISYYGRSILRLEIRADSLPSSAERAQYAAEQKSLWDRMAQTNPLFDHMKMGLSIAAVVVTLAWNIDWKHYMQYCTQYWNISGPPYGWYWEWGFRAFFLVSLISSAGQLLYQILDGHHSARDYGAAGLDSLIWIGFFVIADGAFRWRLRRARGGASS